MNVQDILQDKEYMKMTEIILSTFNIGKHYAKDIMQDTITDILNSVHEGKLNLADIKNPYSFYFISCRNSAMNYRKSKAYGYNYNKIECTAPIDLNNYWEESTVTEFDNFVSQTETKLEESPNTWRDDYKRKLFKIYLKEGSYRKVKAVTKIPLKEIAATIQEFKVELLKLKK